MHTYMILHSLRCVIWPTGRSSMSAASRTRAGRPALMKALLATVDVYDVA
ncbi:hypothetical protein CI238_02191 [Colletotrichum incanum]|uniref:Uncharacterized protein n=1 Tax=Colletotrichum incanum TaxID=1573173 RepID=A0A161X089_COLIC|nr:hypothetical protein CI238_02191 [Colletotrichum incanum]